MFIMPAKCLFCDNTANSQEHIWPRWVHERKNFGPIRHQIGSRPERILPDPEQTVGTVCQPCNNGWMSRLESDNIPLIGLMFADVSVPLDKEQQATVAAWAVKTAIVNDSTQGRHVPRFYTREECASLRLNRTIPAHTRVWIGRLNSSRLHLNGTHIRVFSTVPPARIPGMVINVVVGHLAVQVFSLHPHPDHAGMAIPLPPPKPGDWDNLLVSIWPVEFQYVTWPPRLSFTNGGLLPIAALLDRWRIGQEVPPDHLRR